jgi:hypothetical protein
VLREKPVAALLRVAVAPATTKPFVSVMVPRSELVADCAEAETLNPRKHPSHNITTTTRKPERMGKLLLPKRGV